LKRTTETNQQNCRVCEINVGNVVQNERTVTAYVIPFTNRNTIMISKRANREASFEINPRFCYLLTPLAARVAPPLKVRTERVVYSQTNENFRGIRFRSSVRLAVLSCKDEQMRGHANGGFASSV
jgi:hypothetical protein